MQSSQEEGETRYAEVTGIVAQVLPSVQGGHRVSRAGGAESRRAFPGDASQSGGRAQTVSLVPDFQCPPEPSVRITV